jgi:hypothetical protein
MIRIPQICKKFYIYFILQICVKLGKVCFVGLGPGFNLKV